jgi:hypothetical protein
MSRTFALLFILATLVSLTLTAQDLPDAWSISDDGRHLTAGGENETGFYGQHQVHNVKLEFTQPDYWTLLENNYDSGIDLLATCWIDGIKYDSVGVRFKGQTSFLRNDTEKKSFNITLDYLIDGQDVDGYNTFNLNCGWEDNTSMKEVLYNNIGHNYYMSLKANYVGLEINGVNWGPYQNIQQFDSNYIKEWYLSNDGTIWRAERIGQGGPDSGRFGVGRSTLNYNGPDSSDYNLDYVLKRTEQAAPWAGMIAACDVLNNEPLATLEAALSQVLDIDKACWFLAHENVFADDDGYINKGGSDYYVYYEAETGRIVPMEYDGNSVLGDRAIAWAPFFREANANFPLINRLLAVPSIRQRYLAHVRVILNDYFTPGYADPKIDIWADLIDAMVQDDPKKFYTYPQFQLAITSLKQAIITRRNVIMNDPEMRDMGALTVGEVSYSVEGAQWQSPTIAEEVDVVAQVGGTASTASTWLYYGAGLTGPFSKIEMFDDGQHNDGTAADGQYGASIPPLTAATYGRYYIEAIATNAAATTTYEPKGAEHDVFLYQVNNTSSLAGDLVINEFMASNDTTQADQDGEFEDWIELYNNTNVAVSLDGFHLTDDADNLTKWAFPDDSSIDGNGYLIIWADEDLDQAGLHADFKLSAGGETLLLVDTDGAIVDSITYADQKADISHGRFPNGIGDFQDMSPTFNAQNTEGITDPGDPMLPTSPLAGDLVVNEFMASNDTTQADQDGDFDDWMELYNNTTNAIALDGFHLSDDLGNVTKWAFPAGTSIAGNDYLIIWADEDADQDGLHADFKLSAGGETLLLVDADTALVDSVTYVDQVADVSHGRFPNGTGDFQDMTPTFNAENGTTSTRYTPLIGAELILFPNPTRGLLNVRLEQAYTDDLRFRLFAADGRLLREQVLVRGGTTLEINADRLPEGFYFLAVMDGRAMETHKVVVRR